MNLDDLAFAASAQVPVPGLDEKGEPRFVEVRGLNLVDIMGLVERHKTPLSEAFAGLSGNNDAALKSFGAMSGAFLTSLPEVAADVIAVATDQPKKVASARRIVVSVQLAMLEKIAELTFAAEGGAGKVLEIVVSAVSGTSGVVRSLAQPT